MSIANYKFSDVTRKIIGASMSVHNQLGCGFQEVIYQRALSMELNKCKLNHSREVEMPIFFDDEHIGTRRVDFVVEENVLIEIKALNNLDDIHLAQALNYLEAFKMETGLLINFGSKSLEFKRLINKKYKS